MDFRAICLPIKKNELFIQKYFNSLDSHYSYFIIYYQNSQVKLFYMSIQYLTIFFIKKSVLEYLIAYDIWINIRINITTKLYKNKMDKGVKINNFLLNLELFVLLKILDYFFIL